MDIERLFKISARQRSQVCRHPEEETNVTKIYLIHGFGGDFMINIMFVVCGNMMPD